MEADIVWSISEGPGFALMLVLGWSVIIYLACKFDKWMKKQEAKEIEELKRKELEHEEKMRQPVYRAEVEEKARLKQEAEDANTDAWIAGFKVVFWITITVFAIYGIATYDPKPLTPMGAVLIAMLFSRR